MKIYMTNYFQIDKENSKGFTLIELAVVIVIIGFIVAGVAAGSALIEQSRIRGVISEYQEYKLSYDSFKARYSAIPGDFNRAESYWPNGATGCVAAGGSCNGNGNGIVEYNLGESVLAMRQMFMAGILQKSIAQPGAGGVTTTTARLGVTYPASKVLPGVGLMVNSYVNDTVYPKTIAGLGSVVNISAFAGWCLDPRFGNVLYLGSSRTGGTNEDGSGVLAGSSGLSPSQAIAIEMKIDDAKFDAAYPNVALGGSTGKVRSVNAAVPLTVQTYCVEDMSGSGLCDIGYKVVSSGSFCYLGFYLD